MEAKSRAELLEMYDEVGIFYEGLARARKGDKWFHIRLDGSRAYKEEYTFVYHFHEGLARVIIDRRTRFQIRPDGEIVPE